MLCLPANVEFGSVGGTVNLKLWDRFIGMLFTALLGIVLGIIVLRSLLFKNYFRFVIFAFFTIIRYNAYTDLSYSSALSLDYMPKKIFLYCV